LLDPVNKFFRGDAEEVGCFGNVFSWHGNELESGHKAPAYGDLGTDNLA